MNEWMNVIRNYYCYNFIINVYLLLQNAFGFAPSILFSSKM